ncbi:hypothetical protein WJX73_008501 [Symbiochloris irregularis]|uniref:F-box domain-containing protein n=1 Tax=Symbiochloris irregularis TaxID=706552 RepID=A0AAW1PK29_9CHLO
MATVALTVTEHDFSRWMQPRRPWHVLYGLRLHTPGSTRHEVQLAPIQQLVPEEILADIMTLLGPYTLAKAACVCSQWGALAKRDSLWQAACYDAFRTRGRDETLQLVRRQYRGRWRTMFLDLPHLRFDGVYVSRNTYIRTGITEWRVKNPVHLVCYYRYLRFFPAGDFAYRTCPETIAQVAASLEHLPNRRPRGRSREGIAKVLAGRYAIKGTRLACQVEYPNMAGTQIRTTLELRSTTRGANNRLDPLSIKSYDNAASTPLSVDDELEPEGGLAHNRGTSTYVFVPWEHVVESQLNLPVTAMDFYVPG